MRIPKIELIYFAILFLLLLAVFGFNWIAGGTITNPRELAEGLGSAPDSPQDWGIQYVQAAVNRVLFRWIVQGTWAVFFPPSAVWGFYAVFVFWSFFFFYCALVTLYGYLRILAFDQRTSFLGCLLFLASPPVLLAYKYPVYTREDPLAYFLVVLGLIAVFKSKLFAASLISTAAALTRETTLIMPLTYLIASGESWRKRISVIIPPILAFAAIRLLSRIVLPTDQFEASRLNFQFPFETLAFNFCVFGALWVPYGAGLYHRWKNGASPNRAWNILTTSGPVVLILALGIALVYSRAREARIVFILFPWAIPFALDWFRVNSNRLRTWVTQRAYWTFALGTFALLSLTVLYFRFATPDLMRFYLADFTNGYWLVLGNIHLSITLAVSLPIAFRFFRSPKTST